MTKILVAEDDTFLSSLLVTRLQAEGYETRGSFDGLQTLDQAKSWHPDLLLLDILMPNKDGYEVLGAMRADPQLKDTRVVVLSNLGAAEDREKAKHFEVLDYYVKANTTPQELVLKIKDMLK